MTGLINIAQPQPLSKGVLENGMLPGHEGNLDPRKAGRNWTTVEIGEDGYPKHYVLPTRPGDRPGKSDGTEFGDAVKRYLRTRQHYGAFDSDDAGKAFMRNAQRGQARRTP